MLVRVKQNGTFIFSVEDYLQYLSKLQMYKTFELVGITQYHF